MNKVQPIQVAKWFMEQNLDNPSNSFDGNMKLQKLLFFSQLIYMCENNGKTMYDDEFNAFEHGMVLDNVRKEYQNNYTTLAKCNTKTSNIPETVLNALILTKEIFGNCSAKELSEMSHEFKSWNKYFNQSINEYGCYNMAKSKIPYDELKEELYKIQKVLQAYELTKSIPNDMEEDY